MSERVRFAEYPCTLARTLSARDDAAGVAFRSPRSATRAQPRSATLGTRAQEAPNAAGVPFPENEHAVHRPSIRKAIVPEGMERLQRSGNVGLLTQGWPPGSLPPKASPGLRNATPAALKTPLHRCFIGGVTRSQSRSCVQSQPRLRLCFYYARAFQWPRQMSLTLPPSMCWPEDAQANGIGSVRRCGCQRSTYRRSGKRESAATREPGRT